MRAIHTCVAALVSMVGLLGSLGVFPYSDAEGLIYPACVALTALSAWALWSWKLISAEIFDPYGLFLMAAVLFNGGHALLEVVGLNERGILFNRVSAETVLSTLWLVTLSLAYLHLGALLGMRRRSRTTVTPPSPSRAQNARLIGWALLSIATIPAFVLLRDAIAVVMASGYFGLFQRRAVTGAEATPSVLASFLVPGALFLLAGSRDRPVTRYLSALILIGYAVVRLFLGSRGYGAMALVAYAWLWHNGIHRIPRSVLLGSGATLLLVVFPLLAVVRSLAGGDRLSIDTLVSAYLSIENPAVAIITEMGGSMLTVAYTLELVPESRPFDMGLGYLYALLSLIPNMFWDLHPTVERGLAGHWLTWTVAPATAAAGGGLGFSFIAEAFLNFGWFGTPVVIGAIGYAFGRLTAWAKGAAEPARLAATASALSFVLFFARGESAAQIRALVWYCALPYGAVQLLSAMRQRWGGSKRPQYRQPGTTHACRSVRAGDGRDTAVPTGVSQRRQDGPPETTANNQV